LLFFVDRVSDVLFVQHRPLHLKHFTDENSTILWEPASSNTPVCYSGVKARIIVTVSPNYEEVFRHFENKTNATRFFMSCPSELQIQLMGQIYRRFTTELEYCPNDAEIHQHVKKFGPFIPIALYWSRDQMDELEESRQREIACPFSTENTLNNAWKTEFCIMRTSKFLSGLSHRLA